MWGRGGGGPIFMKINLKFKGNKNTILYFQQDGDSICMGKISIWSDQSWTWSVTLYNANVIAKSQGDCQINVGWVAIVIWLWFFLKSWNNLKLLTISNYRTLYLKMENKLHVLVFFLYAFQCHLVENYQFVNRFLCIISV